MPDDFSTAFAPSAHAADAATLDQASGLRALFARPTLAVLPVLAPAIHDVARTRWIAQLAQAFARSGRRTLAIDAARLQIAATLGVRARFDLAHVLRGECRLEAAALDAGGDLTVLSAARAFEAAGDDRPDVHALIEAAIGAPPGAGADDACEETFDLVMLVLPPEPAVRFAGGLAGCDWLLPILPNSRDLAALLAAARATAEGMNAAITEATGQEGVTAVFRSLFLGMEPTSAFTLGARMNEAMAASAQWRAGVDLHMELKFGGAVRTGRDLARVVQSAAGWDLAQLALPQTEHLESFS